MLIYKIIDQTAWQAACAAGTFAGAAIDLADGFIHFSTATQAEETARRHFANTDNLVLVAFDSEELGPKLVFEPSRGGDLFPHLHAALDPALAKWAKPLPWDGSIHAFPEGWRT